MQFKKKTQFQENPLEGTTNKYRPKKNAGKKLPQRHLAVKSYKLHHNNK
jgi:hypothetical protein